MWRLRQQNLSSMPGSKAIHAVGDLMPSGSSQKGAKASSKAPKKKAPKASGKSSKAPAKSAATTSKLGGDAKTKTGATEGRKTRDQEIISRETCHACGKGCSETPCRQDALNANCLLPAAVPGVTNVKVDS